MCFLGWKPLKAIVVNVCTLCAEQVFILAFYGLKTSKEKKKLLNVCVCAQYQEPQFLDSLVSINNWFQIYINFDSCVELGLLLQWKMPPFLSVCPVSASVKFLP